MSSPLARCSVPHCEDFIQGKHLKVAFLKKILEAHRVGFKTKDKLAVLRGKVLEIHPLNITSPCDPVNHRHQSFSSHPFPQSSSPSFNQNFSNQPPQTLGHQQSFNVPAYNHQSFQQPLNSQTFNQSPNFNQVFHQQSPNPQTFGHQPPNPHIFNQQLGHQQSFNLQAMINVPAYNHQSFQQPLNPQTFGFQVPSSHGFNQACHQSFNPQTFDQPSSSPHINQPSPFDHQINEELLRSYTLALNQQLRNSSQNILNQPEDSSQNILNQPEDTPHAVVARISAILNHDSSSNPRRSNVTLRNSPNQPVPENPQNSERSDCISECASLMQNKKITVRQLQKILTAHHFHYPTGKPKQFYMDRALDFHNGVSTWIDETRPIAPIPNSISAPPVTAASIIDNNDSSIAQETRTAYNLHLPVEGETFTSQTPNFTQNQGFQGDKSKFKSVLETFFNLSESIFEELLISLNKRRNVRRLLRKASYVINFGNDDLALHTTRTNLSNDSSNDSSPTSDPMDDSHESLSDVESTMTDIESDESDSDHEGLTDADPCDVDFDTERIFQEDICFDTPHTLPATILSFTRDQQTFSDNPQLVNTAPVNSSSTQSNRPTTASQTATTANRPSTASRAATTANRPRTVRFSHQKQKSRYYNANLFKDDFTMEQLHTWYSITLTMMNTPRGSYLDYWKKESVNRCKACKFIQIRMPYYIWKEIMQCITGEIDKLAKLAEDTWKKYWIPFRNIAIDEMMIPFKGRCNPHHIFIPRKPHPNGIKVWGLADSKNFVYTFSICKRTTNEENYDPSFARENPPMQREAVPKEPVTETVKKLVDKLPGPGYIVHADSYFGCLEMLEMLVAKDHGAVLACRADRPAFIFKEYLQEKMNSSNVSAGENNCKYTVAHGTVSVTRKNATGESVVSDVPFAAYWISLDDSSPAGQALLSTEHGNPYIGYSVVEDSQREGADDDGEIVQVKRIIPAIRKDYLTLSRFIDQANDLLVGQQGRTHGTTRWKTATILWLLKLIVSNARIIWNSIQEDEKNTRSLTDFMADLAEQLHPLEEPGDDHDLVPISDPRFLKLKDRRCVLRKSKRFKCHKVAKEQCRVCNVLICTSCAKDSSRHIYIHKHYMRYVRKK